MNQPKPTSDPDSKDQLDQMLRDSAHSDGISRLIERLGGRLPIVDLQPTADSGEGVPLATSPEHGQAVGQHRGNLRVLGEIARGGMGVVLRGHELDLRREVAIKVLQQRYANQPDVLARFVEEAQIGGQLQHPGIVPVYEIGVLSDQRPFFTMKLVKGKTLAALLAERADTAADLRQLLDVFQAVCMTMAYAHSRKVIHRDLKPENVMVGAFGEVQVVDWGLAKVMQRQDDAPATASTSSESQASFIKTLRAEPGSAGASQIGSVLGTPAYMPPEQARGMVDDLDERGDVFSLGAILCELLTGTPPYGRDFAIAIERAARGDVREALQRLDGCSADAPLIQLCKQCLAPAPAARPADAGVLARALREYSANVEQRALEARLAAVAATTRAEAAHRTRNLTVALALTVLLAMAIGGGSYLWLRSEREQRLEAGVERANAALAEAMLLRGQQRWPEAAAAARRAADLVPDEAPRAFATSVRQELAALEARARDERDAANLAADNERLLRSLRTIAEPDGGKYAPTDWARVDQQFAAAFAAHGLTVDNASPPALAPLAARGIGESLAQSLVEWAAVRRARADAYGAELLLRIAMALDPDPERTALRGAVIAGNADAVVALAKSHSAINQSSATLIEMVRALRAVQRSAEAIDVQLAACLRHPNDALLAMEVASTLNQARRAQEAARLLQGALAVRPDSVVIRRSLAVTLELQLREYRLAEQLLRESLRHHPDDAYLHLRLGFCLLAKERDDGSGIPFTRQPDTPLKLEALAELNTAIRLSPHADYLQVLGNTLLDLGRFAEAEESARRGLALAVQQNTDAEVRAHLHRNLGIALHRQGDLEGAKRELRLAAELQPENAYMVCTLAVLQVSLDKAASMAAVRAYLEKHPSSSFAHSVLSGFLEQEGQKEEALAEAQRAVELEPENTTYRTAWIAMAWRLDSNDLALSVCEQALRENPGTWELWDLLCLLMKEKGRTQELRVRLEAAMRRDPTNAVAIGELGMMKLNAGDKVAGLELMRRSLELGLDTPGARDNLAAKVMEVEGPAASLGIQDEAIRRWPDLAPLYWRRANTRAQLGQLDLALADAEEAVRLAPHRAFGSEMLAQIHLARREWRSALAAALAALRPPTGVQVEIEPASSPEFALNVGTELIPLLPAGAAELLRTATERQPELAEAWCNLGHALGGAGRHGEALPAMQKGHALGSTRADWEYPSAQWVDRARFLAEMETR
ncbi:MAG: protein kinase, partial [Planctomycetes bacterium]|nr:protein kinase [Planctomycetota bacterium]